jgi:mRNA interferase RelE/StbE
VASYKLLIKPSAAKELEALPEQDRKRTAIKIQRLGRDPRPDGAEKLSGQDRYRLRQGDYRILYAIDDPSATVVIVKIGHRRDVYR